ncbi:hypothetical protein JXM67_02470 [candidate division WOR-3 bacterium]|nr:hypothetical protein [candidate division WOR-3 bacterium]
MNDSHLPQFNALLERTLQQFNFQNIEAGLGEVENQILPAITSMVKPENRAGFRDLVNLVEFHALFPGEYYFTPPLDEIMEIKSCTKVTGTGHIISGLWKCNRAKVKCHIEKIEQEEEEE